MSYKRFILAIVATVLAGFAYTAARPLPDKKDSPHEGGAMGMSMQENARMSPLHRQIMSVFILPEMQSELGLSNQQTGELRHLKEDLVAKAKTVGEQTAARRRELDALLSGDTSRTRAVKALFEKIADLRAQLQYAGFETANKMKALLNDGQKAKFDAMKPGDLHRLMMSHGNMAEMEETMQLMAAGEGMGMQKGMGMQGGMGMQKGMGMQGGMGQGSGMMCGSDGEMIHDAAPAGTPGHSH